MPFTASEPMSPPGKKSGLHDVGVGGEGEPRAADVEHARRRAARSRAGLRKAGEEHLLDQLVRQLARRRRARAARAGYCAIGSGQDEARPVDLGSLRPHAIRLMRPISRSRRAIAVVGGAGAFGRDHRRAERAARACSGVPKAGHSCGLLQPLQDQAADALGRFFRDATSATPNRVSASKAAIRVAQAEAALRESRRCRATCAARPGRPRG